jgi:hypothetical protein
MEKRLDAEKLTNFSERVPINLLQKLNILPGTAQGENEERE